VASESKAVFDNMFAAYERAERSTKWEDIVAALVDTGCSATRTGGSAVTFRDERNLRGSIVFHRPHPDPSADPIMLRSTGKRLRKWFGWEAGTFIEQA